MGKAQKTFSGLLAAALLCAAMSACGSQAASDDPVLGSWQMTTIKVMGQSVTMQKYMAQQHMTTIPTATFSKDYNVVFNISGQQSQGNWEGKDGQYTIKDNKNVSLSCQIINQQLIIDNSNGATLIFEKK